MKQKVYVSKYLRNNNILFTILIVICNILVVILADSNKNTAVSLSIFFNCAIFFVYRMRTANIAKSHWIAVKKELMYVNYPITISAFFFLIFAIFCCDVYWLSTINKDALNATFVFTYFMSTISVLLPAIMMLAYMYLITPAFVLPEKEKLRKKGKTDLIILILFVIFIIFSFSQMISNAINSLNFIKRDKFKAAKLPIQYSTDFLQYTDLSEPVVVKLKSQKIKTPFLYTTEGYKFSNYETARQFCSSMNARVATHKEIYNIIFHRFDTFGEKYYWTSDKAGRNNLVLHFKNMSYEVVKKPENVTPVVYCTSESSSTYKLFEQPYFFKNKPIEFENEKLNVNQKKNVHVDKLNADNDVQVFKKIAPPQYPPPENEIPRHVNFNVQHVTQQYFNELLSKGYIYDSKSKMNSYYSSNEAKLQTTITRDPYKQNVSLCYYPFQNFGNLPILNQKQVWKQSFCSPSFGIVNQVPALKTMHEKDAFCYANDGRVANIPEIMGILKTNGLNRVGYKFWTNNKVSDQYTYAQKPVVIKILDMESVEISAAETNEQAYTFCVKRSKTPSNIIANFKSRYPNENGKFYALTQCPNCKYYEVPDTVLIQY